MNSCQVQTSRRLSRVFRGTRRWLVNRNLLVLVPAVLALSQYDAQAALFGQDDRKQVTAESDGKVAGIGRLTDTMSGRFCTAFCVSDDIIATAGHCLVGSDVGASANPEAMQFSFGASTTTSGAKQSSRLAGHKIGNVKQNIISGLKRLRTRAPMNAADDWAVARLEVPVCRGRVMRLAPDRSSDQQEEQRLQPHAGYNVLSTISLKAWHADTKHATLHTEHVCATPSLDRHDVQNAIRRDFKTVSGLSLHGCDTGPGASGGPLLKQGTAEPTTIAINTGTYTLARTEPSSTGQSNHASSIAIANTAVSVEPVIVAVANLSHRRLLTTRSDVARLQKALNRLGFKVGPTDGIVRQQLIDAATRFDLASQHPANQLGHSPGLIDQGLLDRVIAADRARLIHVHAFSSDPTSARRR